MDSASSGSLPISDSTITDARLVAPAVAARQTKRHSERRARITAGLRLFHERTSELREPKRSSATATTITMPFTTCCQNGDTFSNVEAVVEDADDETPAAPFRSTEPRPPDSDVPPMTTAAIASSS